MSDFAFPAKINVVTEALNRLMAQYSSDRAPNIRAIIQTHAQQWQDIQDAVYEVLTQVLNLTNSIGTQLDILGEMVGQPRNGNDDATYRGFIAIRIAEINSQGTAPELISLFKILMGASLVQLIEYFPAKFGLQAFDATPIIPVDQVRAAIVECKAAGVGIVMLTWGDDFPFVFAGDPSGAGFGGDGISGGDFAGAF